MNRSSSAETLILPFVDSWSLSFIVSMALAGALLGATMTITGAIRRIEDDLLLTGSAGPQTPPFGLLVIVLGILSFWVAAVVHLGISLVQEALTPSRIRLYGSIALLTLLFAVTWSSIPLGSMQTLLWGGNVLFISYLIGWLLGDFFRPD